MDDAETPFEGFSFKGRFDALKSERSFAGAASIRQSKEKALNLSEKSVVCKVRRKPENGNAEDWLSWWKIFKIFMIYDFGRSLKAKKETVGTEQKFRKI